MEAIKWRKTKFGGWRAQNELINIELEPEETHWGQLYWKVTVQLRKRPAGFILTAVNTTRSRRVLMPDAEAKTWAQASLINLVKAFE